MTNLDDIRQEIYEVLNVHNPTDCGGGRCWGVEEIEKIIANQVREARIDELNRQINLGLPMEYSDEFRKGFHFAIDQIEKADKRRLATLNGVKTKDRIAERERLAREAVIKELWETNSTNDDIAESLRLMYCELAELQSTKPSNKSKE